MQNNKRNTFLQKLCKKWGKENNSRPPFIFWKSLIWDHSEWFAAYFRYISIALNLPYNKSKLYKSLDYWSKDMFIFNFSEKGLGLVSPPRFVNGFSRKMIRMLHYINCLNFIVWLPLLLEILDNMCITTVC